LRTEFQQRAGIFSQQGPAYRTTTHSSGESVMLERIGTVFDGDDDAILRTRNKMRSFAEGFEWLSNAVTNPAPSALMQMHLVTPLPLLLRITKPTGGNTCAAVEPKPEPLVGKACSKPPDLHKSPYRTRRFNRFTPCGVSLR
jgi:hypothetical protein